MLLYPEILCGKLEPLFPEPLGTPHLLWLWWAGSSSVVLLFSQPCSPSDAFLLFQQAFMPPFDAALQLPAELWHVVKLIIKVKVFAALKSKYKGPFLPVTAVR